MTSYKLIRFKSREEWKKARLEGITATSAGAVLGVNPWESILETYIKITHKKEDTKEETEAMRKGNQAEPIVRELFKLNYGDEFVLRNPPSSNWIIVNKEKPYFLATPDGLLTNKVTKRKGGLECKFHEVLNNDDAINWRNGLLPNQYFVQVLHTMNAGRFDFYFLGVILKHKKRKEDGTYVFDYYETRFFYFDAKELKEELRYEEEKIDTFWNGNILTHTLPTITI